MTTKAYKRRLIRKRRLPEAARDSLRYKNKRFEALGCPHRDLMMRPGKKIHYLVDGANVCGRKSRPKHTTEDVHQVICHHCWAQPAYLEAHGTVCETKEEPT